jgi:enoyl-[acyl-carrier protein] reductase I
MNRVSLEGKKGLVVGIANANSLAYGCAKTFRRLGAELAVTYRGPKAESYVRPLAADLGCPTIMSCDVQDGGQLEAVFESVRREWGRPFFLLHSVAFAPKEDLHSRVVDCSQAGFSLAMDVSCHSSIRMAKLAEPLVTGGDCLLTMTCDSSEKVVEHYNLMGPVKAALESMVRYLAAELAQKGIRVHAISPGPSRPGRIPGSIILTNSWRRPRTG